MFDILFAKNLQASDFISCDALRMLYHSYSYLLYTVTRYSCDKAVYQWSDTISFMAFLSNQMTRFFYPITVLVFDDFIRRDRGKF